jgi:hypothetical protein
MYVKSTNEIYFPHIIPKTVLDGIEHTWNNVNGGAISISDLNINSNSFFGGNVTRLGFIKEYGFYACQSLYANARILGFYIHDPSRVTELGKRLTREAFPSCKVIFDTYHESTMTDADRVHLREAREDAAEHGLTPELISHSNAEELKALIKSVQSGHATNKVAELADGNQSPILTEDAEHIHIGGIPQPKKILANKMQPRGTQNRRR